MKGAICEPTDLGLVAEATLMRARRAMERPDVKPSPELARVRDAAKALATEAASKGPGLGERTDERADALLDLV